MKSKTIVPILILLIFSFSCYVDISGSGDEDTHGGTYVSFLTRNLFPFDCTKNWWKYSEAGGNFISVTVDDTITDDRVTYYKVRFLEPRVDTTDDWFKSSLGSIFFSNSLSGMYNLLIPSVLHERQGCYSSDNNTVHYTYYDSITFKGTKLYNVVTLQYTIPLIHGFEEITFADSIGIIQFKDTDGRWPIVYELDSCQINQMKHCY